MAEEKVAAKLAPCKRVEEREHVGAVAGVDKMVGPEEYFTYLITYDEVAGGGQKTVWKPEA
jgi:hypothetical protein